MVTAIDDNFVVRYCVKSRCYQYASLFHFLKSLADGAALYQTITVTMKMSLEFLNASFFLLNR